MGLLDKIKDVLGYTEQNTEADALFKMARRNECSEYDLFVRAANRWNIPMSFVSRDFKRYLVTQQVPHYVRDLVRSEFDEDKYRSEMNEILAALFSWLDRRKTRGK